MSKNDPGSSYSFDIVYAAGSVTTSGSTVYTSAVDHSGKPSATFVGSVGAFTTSFVSTLQSSATNDSDWTDEPNGAAGNDVSATLTEAGSFVVNVPNPRKRYSRLKLALGGDTTLAVAAVVGPVLYKEPGATTLES